MSHWNQADTDFPPRDSRYTQLSIEVDVCTVSGKIYRAFCDDECDWYSVDGDGVSKIREKVAAWRFAEDTAK